ncbi:Shedu immune nuclease family protein [Xanthomonas nasturtii]|uniref:DUF4263 domain-containing protein n=1 Tax=Xanthomonas nasturtii TaxID=1843581 RepID=A0A3E1KDE6_9XANT|nr:Shedu immune nuclease family protein [Xanthomonas nasturtii]MCL1532614.1 DUF4263 domain-containing protein [Xanthomonas nasturtii]MCL1567465.1 DUF4263 domain-containing protein [Xanthomonas nasturtii]RFF36597.1 DUF4263 domain-containing protein [Xanthomonas nasturtii]
MPSVPNSEYRLLRRTDGGPFVALLTRDEMGIPTDEGEPAFQVDVYFSDVAISDDIEIGSEPWIRIMSITEDLIEIMPVQQRFGHSEYGKPIYKNVKSIFLAGRVATPYKLPENNDELDDLLESMPAGFYKNWRHGLGVQWDYRVIIKVIDDVPGVSHIFFHAPADVPRADYLNPPFYALCINTFNQLRKEVKSISNRHSSAARKEKRARCYNVLLHRMHPESFERQRIRLAPDALAELTNSANGDLKLSKRDQQAAVTLVRRHTNTLAKTEPNELLRLKQDIEAVSLRELIERCEALLESSSNETRWQAFLTSNPFVLTMAFHYPVIKIGDTPYVGGKVHTGTEGKFSDFLMAAAATNNVAVVEIKSPSMRLLGSEYRSGVFPPSQDLSGAVAQAIAQRISFQENFSTVGKALDRQGYRAYSIACLVIAGKSPDSEDQRQDFERYRHSLHGVHIVTFDELIDRLRAIYDLMTYKPEPPKFLTKDELPF